jgi:PAS domain-containing protein
VAELIAEGLTNRQVGERLFVSPHTVDFHIRQIYRRLGVYTRVELARCVYVSKRAAFAMFDGVMDGITVLEPIWDAEGEIADFRIVYANPASVDALGRQVSDLVGQQLRGAYPANTPGAFYARVFTSGEPLELRDIEREETVDGIHSVTRFDVRVIRHEGYVIVAHRTIGVDGYRTT